jgi:hypothetical protein
MMRQSVSIWFFIGSLLLVYGILILGAGIYGLWHPPQIALSNLHAGIWWGALLVAVGAVYSYAFFPGRKKEDGSS